MALAGFQDAKPVLGYQFFGGTIGKTATCMERGGLGWFRTAREETHKQFHMGPQVVVALAGLYRPLRLSAKRSFEQNISKSIDLLRRRMP